MQCAKRSAGEKDGQCSHCVRKQTPKKARVVAGKESHHCPKTELATGINVIVGSSKEVVEVCFHRAGRLIGAQSRKIRGGLAVEYAELAKFRTSKALQTVRLHSLQQAVQAVP